MGYARLSERRFLASLALGLSLAAWAVPRESRPLEGTASAELDEESMDLALRVRLGPASAFGLRIGAEAELVEAKAFLELGEGGGSSLAFGPASPAGALRFLLDPASAAALSAGPPVSVDGSLEAGRAALMIGSEGLRAFAIGESDGAEAMVLRAAAAGIAVGGSGRLFAWSALADASSRDGEEGGGGWSPEPRPDSGGTLAHAAILARRAMEGGEARAAIAASTGALEGTGLAARVQARGTAGPVSLNLSIGACGAAYRGLFGEAPRDALRCRAEARLALRRSASLSAAAELFAERSGRLTAPSWGSSGSLSAKVPVDEGVSCSFEGIARADPPAAGGDAADLGAAAGLSSAKVSMAIARRSEAPLGGATRSSLRASAEWKRVEEGIAMEGFGLTADFSRDNGERWPSAAARLALDFPVESGSALVARGWLEASLPLGASQPPGPGFRPGTSRRISIRLDLPAAGIALVPLAQGEAAPAFSASIAYRASL
jgi:hypothetical protein